MSTVVVEEVFVASHWPLPLSSEKFVGATDEMDRVSWFFLTVAADGGLVRRDERDHRGRRDRERGNDEKRQHECDSPFVRKPSGNTPDPGSA